ENVIVETVKKAENQNGYIVRMYEYQNALTQATIHFATNVSKVYRCNLQEDDMEEISCEDNQITVSVKPFEIVTFRIVE
ncbi:MAG: hypothetical protein K0R90_1502, partial [Oscillospiraceae bacterium]|nr:hypothetical protein [Oscillospiraceae bacterium]